ncbi:Os04g0674750 [Oryza sativa Japonica Group]|uniref:Os04g0674750 protein n=1 Tax=Oryza sativa subsp. japonica TaxID=39947 RepID=A0A0P0WGA7_ORYSJ|nr:hypothetical protein EE612_026238 [Oryza sativa]BAS91607.1 Os04g0674750 [Oryza sativa Japonica Group]
MQPPRSTISPMVDPSRGTLRPVSPSTTSTSAIPGVRTPCLALSRARSEAGSLSHSPFHAHESTRPAVSVSPYPWLTSKPIASVRYSTAAGGGAPAVRIRTFPGSGFRTPSGAFASMLSTTGAPHRWLTPRRAIVSNTSAASTRRRQTLVPPTTAIPHGKLQPLAWNMGSVHRYVGRGGTAQSTSESTVMRKIPRWQCTTPLGADVVPEV